MAATLELVGDPWTLLIVREAFKGVRRFEQWQAKLGVARNVLAARLKVLTEHGILDKQTYSVRPTRQEYVLTAKGAELLPILAAMLAFGDKHIYGEGRAPQTYTHTVCGQRFHARMVCDCCGQDANRHELRASPADDALTVGEVLDLAEA